MKRSVWFFLVGLLAFSTVQAAHQSSWASRQQTVGGLVINIGVVPAKDLSRFPPEAAHGSTFPTGTQHLVVSLSDAKTGQHVEAEKVSARIRDPKGKVQEKDLALGYTAGFPDYSNVFMFGYSGKYPIELTVRPKEGRPVQANFVVEH